MRGRQLFFPKSEVHLPPLSHLILNIKLEYFVDSAHSTNRYQNTMAPPYESDNLCVDAFACLLRDLNPYVDDLMRGPEFHRFAKLPLRLRDLVYGKFSPYKLRVRHTLTSYTNM